MFFKRKKANKNQDQLNNMLALSFKHVSNDIYNIFSWLNYLNERILDVQKQLDYMPKSKQEIKNIIDSYYSYENISKKINQLNERVEYLTSKQKSIPEELDEIRTRIRNMATLDDVDSFKTKMVRPVETQLNNPRLDEINERLKHIELRRKATAREKFVQRITRNSKEYIKNVIESLIRKYGKIPALKLKEMVVDEQGLCSKSSFYRILNEVEEEDKIDTIKKGREKQYLSKIAKKL